MPDIAILLPCYNEEQTIAKVVGDFRAALPEATVYVYDNNSTDGSAELARKAGAVVVPEYRQGKGYVIRSMFRDIDADCYILADADDTYPAAAAPRMAELVLTKRADMVIGDRLSSTYFTQNKRRLHGLGNVLVRRLINWLFHGRLNDIMTGYRAFSRPFVKGFPVLSTGFEIETEMTVHALDKRFLLHEMAIEYSDRPKGSESKLRTGRDGARVLATIFRLFKDYRPLLFFGIVSAVFFLVGALMFLVPLIEYLSTGLVLHFPTLIVSGFILLGAMLSLVCGLILDTLRKQHLQDYELMLNILNSQQERPHER
ncbi:MAG: glycosyltransferase family 2 protein [Lachnospiraceae bacterium]|nr:glycosyltransferase family 2 protein [Lachnospiraceae bacterium]